MTHDRVMRLAPVFDTPEAAARFAMAHALRWIGDTAPQAGPRSTNPQD